MSGTSQRLSGGRGGFGGFGGFGGHDGFGGRGGFGGHGDRGGRGGRGGWRESRHDYDRRGDSGPGSSRSRSRQESIIGFMNLNQHINSNPRDSLMFSSCSAFLKLLSDELKLEENPDWIDMMLTILRKSFEVDPSMREFKEQLVVELMKDKQENFLKEICIERFIEALRNTDGLNVGLNIDRVIKSLDNYLDIYYEVCTLDPFANKKFIKAIRTVLMVLKLKVHQEGVEQLAEVCERFAAIAETSDKNGQEAKVIKKGAKQEKSGRMLTEEKPQDDFRNIPVHPTVRDLENMAVIRRNKKSGAFDSVDDYLDIQFRLLREDFISTLRNGIKQYKENLCEGGERLKFSDVSIYEGVHITNLNFGSGGLTYSVRFDEKIIEKINWDSSKKLMYGSLLCLSLDTFTANFLFAKIVVREAKTLKHDGTIEVQFIPESQAVFDAMDNKYGPFTVVESTAYFESYTHILKGMQNIDQSKFPLSRYIVSCDTEIARPAYSRQLPLSYMLDGVDGEEITLRLDEDVRNQSLNGEMLGMNDSQFSAFISALTEEFSVIQGPPGTGKTHVGLKIVQTLLYNLYGVWKSVFRGFSELSRPILIVCYTNHALDQFLEGILEFCHAQYMVRVGGRSKSKILEPCNLKDRRFKADRWAGLRTSYYEKRNEKDATLATGERLQNFLKLAEDKKVIVTHEEKGFIEDYVLRNQLNQFGDHLKQKHVNPNDAIKVWLECENATFLQNIEEADKLRRSGQEKIDTSDSELIDFESEADRELQNRQLDIDEDDSKFVASVNQIQLEQPTHSRDVQDLQGLNSLQSLPLMDKDGFTLVMNQKKRNEKIQKLLSESDRMKEEEVKQLVESCSNQSYNITEDMDVGDRWRLYRYWLWKYKQHLTDQLHRTQRVYQRICCCLDELRQQQDIDILKQAKVIGMTTTGAARYQQVLQQVGAPIVIVEEAAEVLEAHITTALSTECQHLILIGDHKQLKPSPTVYELAKQCHLDLSLFERMVNNGFPVKTLNIQHRMRPEVSKFMRHIYDDLRDHQSVLDRDPVRGLSSPVYLFNHEHLEKTEEGTMSRSNEFEADMVVNLTRYLMLQEYKPSEITIITMYTGQLLVLKRKMSRDEFDGVKITSVDNFQGEENTIIILSLVRSNLEGKLGFVKIENRVCVSLSRAKYGMYVFGNFDMFSRGSHLWTRVVGDAKAAGELGSILELSCVNHGQPAEVRSWEDFEANAPDGGCKVPCGEKLNCGHFCVKSCHYLDRNHERYECHQPCARRLTPCGHSCPVECYEECPRCEIMETVTFPCAHSLQELCWKKGEHLICKVPCIEPLVCGHTCAEYCSQPCTTQCEVIVKGMRMCSRCEDFKGVKCYTTTLSVSDSDQINKCDTPCKEILSCGHVCSGTCYQCRSGHISCSKRCSKALPCGHDCDKNCGTCRGSCWPCEQSCLLICSHGSQCPKLCYESCEFLHSKGNNRCGWGCQIHNKQCSRTCTELCSSTPCDWSCNRRIKCQKCNKEAYKCRGVCGERCPFMCPTCDRDSVKNLATSKLGVKVTNKTLWIFLRDCFHTLPVSYMDDHVRQKFSKGERIVCPYPDCQRPVLNTSRYLAQSRAKRITIIKDYPRVQAPKCSYRTLGPISRISR